MSSVRLPAVAGMFYPSDPQALSDDIDQLLKEVTSPKLVGKIVALIVPHAGYQYSGFTAANGYKLLQTHKFETVVIVSPSHREYFQGISVYDGSAYRTPLGNLMIDVAVREELIRGDSVIKESSVGHTREHAVEVHLPFLQKTIGDTTIVPIVMGDQKREFCFHLGEKLGDVLKSKNALIIASTDLSHYYPYEQAQLLDKIVIDDVAKFDYERLMENLESERTEACGGGPTVAVLVAAKKLGADSVTILHKCNSGDVTGDHCGVVGYLSAVVTKTN